MPVAGTGNRVRRQGRPPHRAGESDGQDKTQHQAQAINIKQNQKVAAQVLWRGARYSAALEEETSTTAAGTAGGEERNNEKRLHAAEIAPGLGTAEPAALLSAHL
jgi:hypothetical protein